MSRLQSIILTVAAVAIVWFSLMPPWVQVVPIRPPIMSRDGSVDAPELALTSPLGRSAVWNAPDNEPGSFVRIDYGRLVLYYVATIALTVPFYVWRRRSGPTASDVDT